MRRRTNRYNYLLGGIMAILVIAAAIWLTPAIARNKKQEKQLGKAEKIIIIDEEGNRTTYYTDNLPSSVKKTIEGTLEASSKTPAAVLRFADAVVRDLDISGLTREVTKTLSEVRVSDFTAEIDRAIADIDWQGINMEVDRTLDDLHRELSNPRLTRDMRVRLEEVQDELAVAADDMGNDIASARDELITARRELLLQERKHPVH